MKIKNPCRPALLVSGVIILIAVVMTLCGYGVNLGLDFAGGLSMPYDLERLIHAVLGEVETRRYLSCVNNKRLYQVTAEQLNKLNAGIFPAVISWSRREKIIQGVYSSSTYILDPGSAMAYGGVQDYRATAGEGRPALILTERSPILSADTVAKAMNISVAMLRERLNLE